MPAHTGRLPDQRQLAFAAVLLLANRMQTVYDARLGDLTLKQWLALIVIARLPQPVASTAALTGLLGTSHQNVSKLLRSLAAKGFLSIQASPDDARARQIVLTSTAQRFFAANADQGERMLDELFAGVDAPDLAACLRVLDSMSRSLTGEGLLPAVSEVG